MRRTRKVIHQWLKDREMDSPCIVLRIDDYATTPHSSHGQFYTVQDRLDDKGKAIWPSEAHASEAAKWATKKFGHQYGVFRLVSIIEPAAVPVKITVVR